MRRRRQIIVLALLLTAAGCLYVPHRATLSAGPDVPATVGNARSTKPIRPGVARRADVEQILGEPHERDGSRLRYYWEEEIGTMYTLWNPFNDSHVHPQPRQRMIELRFDYADVLRDYRIKGVADYVAYEKLYPTSRPSDP